MQLRTIGCLLLAAAALHPALAQKKGKKAAKKAEGTPAE